MFKLKIVRRSAWVLAIAGLTGCTVHPPGEQAERDSASKAGKPFKDQIEVRAVPALPEHPTPEQLVKHALLTNPQLEQRYWEWRSAIEQIPQDGTQTTTLNLSGGTSITKGHASWGSSTVSLSNDPMTDIKWPGKLDAAAKQTLETARAAGQRFLNAKYDLRNKVLGAYYDFALNAELIRLEQSNQQLLETIATTTAARNRTGTAGQQDVMKADNEVDLSRNDIAAMQSNLLSERAQINALLNRPASAPLPAPTALPAARPITHEDSELIDLAAQHNPELIALADEIHGRQEGIRSAKLQYVPDFNFSAGTDLMGITQSILGQATIPVFRYEAINAAIDQSVANLHASEAMRRQKRNDLTVQIIDDITTIHVSDRQLDLLEHAILPRARRVVAIGRSDYETGRATLLNLLDNQRSLIAIQRLVANLQIIREKRLIDLETIVTVDLASSDPKPLLAAIPFNGNGDRFTATKNK